MRKLTFALILAALILAFAVVPAFAKVDGVSQAGCGNSDNSGASVSGSHSPGGPIPVTASDGRHQGRGGDGSGDCDVPLGPPSP